MKKRIFRNRKTRYAGISIALSVLVIVVVVLVNSLFGSLANRYQWYTEMNAAANYDVTGICYSLLDRAFSDENSNRREDKVRILFCDSESVWEEDYTQSFLYHTAKSIDDKYDNVEVEFHNIKLDPDSVREYAKDPDTNEPIVLDEAGVIIVCGSYHRFYTLEEFFVFSDETDGTIWGYRGERTLAAGILRALDPNPKTACLTANHGEIFYDYELIFLLDAAGYNIQSSFDLAKEDIPDDCTLIITSNPNSDIDVSEGIAEDQKLDAFLSKDGNSYLVFIENGTPKLSNLEKYLEGWGVKTSYYQDSATGKNYRYTVQDTSNSLTSDGYTIYGELSTQEYVAKAFEGLNDNVVFKNATAMTHASDFAATGSGSYEKGNRTLYGIYESGENAVLWANGVARNGDDAMLMTLTEQKNATGGSSYVSVMSSVQFAEKDQIQTAVLSNADVLQRLFATVGQRFTTEGIPLKPFSSTNIGTITTAQMLRWTICLTVIPAGVIALAGVVILARRRRF